MKHIQQISNRNHHRIGIITICVYLGLFSLQTVPYCCSLSLAPPHHNTRSNHNNIHLQSIHGSRTLATLPHRTTTSTVAAAAATTGTLANRRSIRRHLRARHSISSTASTTSLHVKQEENRDIDEEVWVDNNKPVNHHNDNENVNMDSNRINNETPRNNSINYNTLQEKLFLGIQPTPEIISIMAIYFVEGALGLARLAQTFYLKDTLHLGPAELSALTGLFSLPWTIKPIYGFISDGLPLFGYRRRSYLILCGFLGAFSYLALSMNFFGLLDGDVSGAASNVENAGMMVQATIASLIVSSGCIAFSDVVADGIVVERTRDSNDPKVAGGLQSLCWGSAAIGGLLSAYFSGSLLEVMGPLDVFKITAVLPLLVATIAFFINEEPMQKSYSSSSFGVEMQPDTSNIMSTLPISATFSQETKLNDNDKDNVNGNTSNTSIIPQEEQNTSEMSSTAAISDQIQSLWKAIKEPAVWKPAFFLFLWQSTPTSDGAFLYFMTNDLGFGPEFLGRVRVVTAVASLVGVWGYQKFLRTVPIKKILLWTSIASAPLGLINLLLISHTNRSLGIPDGAFVFGDDVVLAILGEFAFLPTLVLAARICPPGVEAVLFATLMSIFNSASTVGTEVGALLTKMLGVTENNFDNLGLLTIICNLTSLYPLLFIGLLDGVGTKSEAEIEEEGSIR